MHRRRFAGMAQKLLTPAAGLLAFHTRSGGNGDTLMFGEPIAWVNRSGIVEAGRLETKEILSRQRKAPTSSRFLPSSTSSILTASDTENEAVTRFAIELI